MDVVRLREALAAITEHWDPHVVAELNGQQLRLAKLQGEFIWHAHEQEDELFLGLEGELELRLRDRSLRLGPGELAVIPRGVEHLPVAREEVHVLLFEPAATVNTGTAGGDRTREELKRI